jgi:hypothetical protein
MKKERIPIDQVIADLKELFKVQDQQSEDNASYIKDGEFNIDKRQFDRIAVMTNLQNYFASRIVDGGHVVVDPITFVFTSFEVREGAPINA